jgi:cofilin
LSLTDDKYRYAECFICKNVGHLASQCPENSNKSIYPRGGSCFTCGGTDHLSRYCPNKTAEERVAEHLSVVETRREERENRGHLGSKRDDQVDLGDDETVMVKSKRKADSDEAVRKKAKRKSELREDKGSLEDLAREMSTVEAGDGKSKKKAKKVVSE